MCNGGTAETCTTKLLAQGVRRVTEECGCLPKEWGYMAEECGYMAEECGYMREEVISRQ